MADTASTDRPWHTLDADALRARLDAGADGLSADEASRRLAEHGPNALEAGRGVGLAELILKQIRSPLVYLLAGAAAVSLAMQHYVDAGVIAGVLLLNTVLGVVQEWRAERALEALGRMAAPRARVLRGGREVQIPAAEVVSGDVLIVEAGDRVAADARVLDATDLQVNESALTGESHPVSKAPGALDADAPLAERANMLYLSTAVTAGRGRAMVVATGMDTALGEIAGQVRSAEREETPLQRRLGRLGTILGVAGVVLAGAIAGLGVLRGEPFVDMLLFAVAVAVAAIPEGLPAVVSVTLALGVQRMADRHAIVRRLPAVETLGSTTVICTDKTGTLTRNQMTVTTIRAGRRTFDVTGAGYEPTGEIVPAADDAGEPLGEVRRLAEAAALANNAELTRGDDGEWDVIGDPTEGAIWVFAHKAGFEPAELRDARPRLDEIPFSSDSKYQAVLCEGEQGGALVCVKGAPERVIDFCMHAMIDGEPVELTDGLRREFLDANERFAADALRVVAGAYRELPDRPDELTEDHAESGLTLAGLWGMVDPARPAAVEAVGDAHGAGIRVVMITGDQPVTAGAIARETGIAAADAEVLTGRDLDAMDADALAERSQEVSVFARVSPSHKLKIMDALKSRGQIVAMTGDGVNDAPALKGADIGVAMGAGGTEVAREAADMVLTDDNFETIVHAVEEGRVIFANIQRVVFFLIATNLGEILTLAGALLIGLNLPLTAIMILWVNLVTDGACTVPLGIEGKHRDVLRQPPRPPDKGILDATVLRRLVIVAVWMAAGTLGLFYLQARADGPARIAHARTVAFTVLSAFQWFQALNARSRFLSVFSIGLFANRWLLAGLAGAVVLQVVAVHTPVGHALFGTTHLSAGDWAAILATAGSIWVLDELLKLIGFHGRAPKPGRTG